MKPYDWTIAVGELPNLTHGWPDDEAPNLVIWAMQAAHGLAYLLDLDEETFGTGVRRPPSDFHQAIEISHDRWAAGSVVTALDLAAAALGRLYLPAKTDDTEYAPSDFFDDREGGHRRSLLPPRARAWIEQTWGDAQYQTMRPARNPLTHGRPKPIVHYVTVGRTPGSHGSRSGFLVGPKATEVQSRDLIEMGFGIVKRRLGAFLSEIKEGTLLHSP